MADKRLTIQTGGFDVDSRLSFDPAGKTASIIRITSTCQGAIHKAMVNVAHRTGYTAEQAEYDIEQARWASAAAAAGKAHIETLIPTILSPTPPTQIIRSLSQPEHPKPTPPPKNTGTK